MLSVNTKLFAWLKPPASILMINRYCVYRDL